MSTWQRVAVGFLCAALSVATFHQGMILLLREIGMLAPTARVWSFAPNPYGVPVLLNLTTAVRPLDMAICAPVWPVASDRALEETEPSVPST